VAVVSPDHADRIAFNDSGAEDEFGVAHLTRSVRVTDIVSGDRATHSGASLWTHPETGAACWLGDRSVGVVNFDALTFDQVGSDHEQIGGFGFVSDDPSTLLVTTYDVDGDILVLRGPEEEALYRSTTVFDFMKWARMVAVHRPTNTVLLTGGRPSAPGVSGDVVIASRDGGVSWEEVGDSRGLLYFLSDRDEVFQQTGDDLLMLSLVGSASVSAAGKAATAWGGLKRAR
jgi:hypothetical protein